MKYTYVPVMYNGKQVGTAQIDAGRLVISIADLSIKRLVWDNQLLTDVSISVPGSEDLTITPFNESKGNTNG